MFVSTFTINGQNYHTQFKYDNEGLLITNSYPKGGLIYTSANGQEFVYVVFWTSISNETADSLELNINFAANLFTLPSSPNINFQLYIPNEEMTPEKEALMNYGLDVTSFLDDHIHTPTNLKTILTPFSTHHFYTVAISDRGIDGTLRAGLELKEDRLIYNINHHKIECGKLVIKK